MDYSSIWSLFSHTRVNTGSSLQETSKLIYLPKFPTEYKSVAITGKYDDLCSRCREKTKEEKNPNQNPRVFIFLFSSVLNLLTAAQAWWGNNPLTCHFCAVSVALPIGGIGWCMSKLVCHLPSLAERLLALCPLQNIQGEMLSSTGFSSTELSGLDVAVLIYISWKSLT